MLFIKLLIKKSFFIILVPKRIYSLKNNRYLSFQESQLNIHSYSQVESPTIARNMGYLIQPANDNTLKRAIKSFLAECSNTMEIVPDINFLADSETPQKFGARYLVD